MQAFQLPIQVPSTTPCCVLSKSAWETIQVPEQMHWQSKRRGPRRVVFKNLPAPTDITILKNSLIGSLLSLSIKINKSKHLLP